MPTSRALDEELLTVMNAYALGNQEFSISISRFHPRSYI
jgi:hypothetical protein